MHPVSTPNRTEIPENLDFYEAVESLRDCVDDDDFQKKAIAIYSKFVWLGSGNAINIPGHQRAALDKVKRSRDISVYPDIDQIVFRERIQKHNNERRLRRDAKYTSFVHVNRKRDRYDRNGYLHKIFHDGTIQDISDRI